MGSIPGNTQMYTLYLTMGKSICQTQNVKNIFGYKLPSILIFL